jgi:hypothetical protein
LRMMWMEPRAAWLISAWAEDRAIGESSVRLENDLDGFGTLTKSWPTLFWTLCHFVKLCHFVSCEKIWFVLASSESQLHVHDCPCSKRNSYS